MLNMDLTYVHVTKIFLLKHLSFGFKQELDDILCFLDTRMSLALKQAPRSSSHTTPNITSLACFYKTKLPDSKAKEATQLKCKYGQLWCMTNFYELSENLRVKLAR